MSDGLGVPEEGLEGALRGLTSRLSPAGPGTVQAGNRETENWLKLGVGGQAFALPVAHVEEIVRSDHLTRLAEAPSPVLGALSFHHRRIPVVDLHARLGLDSRDDLDACLVVVVTSRQRLFGLLVDSVEEVLQVPRSVMRGLPRQARTQRSNYIVGVFPADERFVILLHLDRLLGGE